LAVDEVLDLHWFGCHENKGRRPIFVRKARGAAGIPWRSLLFLA
jgi:hypothetical protein